MTHLTRRRALLGMLDAPVVIRTAGLLMPVKAVPVQWRSYDYTIGGWITLYTPGHPEGRRYRILGATLDTPWRHENWTPT